MDTSPSEDDKIVPTEYDIVYHLRNSIEGWLNREDDSYWHVGEMLEDSSFRFAVSYADETIKTWTVTVQED